MEEFWPSVRPALDEPSFETQQVLHLVVDRSMVEDGKVVVCPSNGITSTQAVVADPGPARRARNGVRAQPTSASCSPAGSVPPTSSVSSMAPGSGLAK